MRSRAASVATVLVPSSELRSTLESAMGMAKTTMEGGRQPSGPLVVLVFDRLLQKHCSKS
jgi:hypothetical protein